MVMVSHDHKFIFLKTRKTAGTSIEMFLQPFCTAPGTPVSEKTHTIESKHGIVGRRLLAKSDDPTSPDNRWFNHMKAAKVKQNLGSAIWNSYLKIAAVRDPYDRMVSQFHYFRRNDDPLPDTRQAHQTAFREYILQTDWNTGEDIVSIGGEFIPQVLIRYEHLTQDLTDLADRLGLDAPTTQLAKTKVTSDRRKGFSVPDYFDPQTLAVTQDRLAWYFDKGDYALAPSQT